MWRWVFFTLLSHTSTPVSRFRFIDLDPAAVFVPVAFFFDTVNYSQYLLVATSFILQTFCWSAGKARNLAAKVPFCIDICNETFEKLNGVLDICELSTSKEHSNVWLDAEKDKICLYTLNLLKLQVYSSISLHLLLSEGINCKVVTKSWYFSTIRPLSPFFIVYSFGHCLCWHLYNHMVI